MITPTLNTDGITGSILIEPNRPISWPDNVRFIQLFSLLSLVIASLAIYQGFFLVLPYSGMEILFLSICLYLVYKHYSIHQIIFFTSDRIIIESGTQRIEYQRHWSKFYIDNNGHYEIPRLCIRSRGITTEIGGFLGYADKLILINLVKKITSGFTQTNTNISL